MRALANALSLLIIIFPLVSPSTALDTLTLARPLADGQTLVSSGGSFALGFFTPGEYKRYLGIWYNKITVQTVVWVANRESPVTNPGATLSVSPNGSLVITDGNSTTLWSTPAVGSKSTPVVQLLDDGNLVVRDEGVITWQSFDYPTDTLLPGMKLGWNLTSGLNRNLTSWKSPSDPSPGEYRMWLDIQGDPQVFLQDGSSMIWRAGPWDGLRFTGMPQMRERQAFNFCFVDDRDEMYYAFYMLNASVISRLVVGDEGTMQRLVWQDQDRSWDVFWFAPSDPCDDVSPCGPYGVCNANDSPICGCLPGFKPAAGGGAAGGCVRRTGLDCRNGTDGFVAVSQAKLPDTSRAVVEGSMRLEDCRAACLRNCTCTAYASANVKDGGSGCIMWGSALTDLRVYMDDGQDLYVRLAAADLDDIISSNKHHKWGQALVIALVSAFLGSLLLAWTCAFMCRKKQTSEAPSSSTLCIDESNRGSEFELPLFDFDTMVAATEGFSDVNKLGQGGFGPVYKGKLQQGQYIALKRLAKTSIQGVDEFKNELVLIAKLQHRNLVRLLGCCIEGEERILVYEYMPNKSLDVFLFNKEKGALLDWEKRYHIIAGIARGLIYLHQDSRFRIIHRDLKAGNILLDIEMNPKISDFGMARMFGGDETEVNTKKVVGTYGYMSPEYAMDGVFSVKSDVFSFGVLVLEIVSGKKSRGVYLSEPDLNLLGYAWSLWKESKSLELIDTSIGGSFKMVEAMRCIKIGLLCVQERPEDRPTMSSVVFMLSSDIASLPEPKQPGFITTRCSCDTDLSSSQPESLTINEVTFTIFEGR